jgi:hypothetical protein
MNDTAAVTAVAPVPDIPAAPAPRAAPVIQLLGQSDGGCCTGDSCGI